MAQPDRVEDVLRKRTSFARRADNQTYAALALAAATLAALIWANLGDSYERLWSITAGVDLGGLGLHLSLGDWVDQGLMALFFFSVGLDVRRELTIGELRDGRRAILPVVGAVGGLIVPAGIFLLISHGQEFASAWGSVISTDTAFAIGMLALVGPRHAPRLRVFLLTLAVVDDIGALSVIALFYTEDLNLIALGIAVLGLIGIWVLQRLGVWRVAPYLVLAVPIWVALYEAGVHATLAGVLIALLMPTYQPRTQDIEDVSVFFRLFRQAPAARPARTVRDSLVHAVPLNQRLSEVLPPYVNYLVVPLFALANAGVALSGEVLVDALGSRLLWAVLVGLVIGKLVGISVACALVLRLVPSARLPGLDLPRIIGAAALSGMGFTISLLVVGIAISDEGLQDQARIGVLAASLLALVLAWVIFRLGDRFAPLPTPAGETLQRDVDPSRDHIRGDLDAPATLVVYAAMDNAYRRHTADALRGVRHRLGADELRIVFRHHTETDEEMTAALALEAAAAQDRFWELHDALVRAPEEIDEDSVTSAAQSIGLDVDAFIRRIRRTVDASRIDDDNLDARTAEFPGTPVLFAQGQRVHAPANTWSLGETLRTALETN